MANSALTTSSLDFDTIRGNLVTFMQGQSQFQGINFQGPNIGVLLDLLAYNTYLNSYYTNMAISEAFLDSAQLYDSVVSRAKELNYTPRSYASAVAYVNINLSPPATNQPYSIVIPAYTTFSGRMDTGIYTFSTPEPVIAYASNNYVVANVALYEGQYVTDTFVTNSIITNQRYLLTNPQIDTSSLVVTVQNSTTDTTNSQFLQATTLLGYNSNSQIYFVQAAQGGQYELIFGDGVIGQALNNGNVVNALYRVASGSIVNSVNSFSPTGALPTAPAGTNVSVTTIVPALGGAAQESMSSIKYNAPRHYQTQDRAITTNDYKTILYQAFPAIRALNVYGGETLTPPDYGTVYISVDLNNYTGLPSVIAQNIKSFISTKTPVEITTEVVAADYTYIGVNANVLYNINATTATVGMIQNTIINTIQAYNNASLNDFNVTYRYSKLAAAIDGCDPSIVSTNLFNTIIKENAPVLNQGSTQLLTVNYQNAIVPGTFSSSAFTYNGLSVYLQDDNAGNINIVQPVIGVTQNVLKNIGTINYTTGLVSFNLPSISAYVGDYVQYNAQCNTPDFSVYNNVVLMIHPEDITVTVTGIRQ